MKSTLQSDGTLKEMPDMQEPDYPDTDNYTNRDGVFDEDNYEYAMERYERSMEAYNAALSKCRQLQVVGTHGWKTGDVVEEGKDYEVKPCTCTVLGDCRYQEQYEQKSAPCQVAVPIADQREYNYYCQDEIEGRRICLFQCDHCEKYYKPLESDSQEELWNEVLTALGFGFTNREKFISQAKEQFTITRKQ